MSWVAAVPTAVPGDSTVTNLYCTGAVADPEDNAVTVVGMDGTVYVQGTSGYTVTVTGYDTEVDASNADSWSDSSVAKP